MPTYCYKRGDHIIERVFKIGAAPKVIRTQFGLARRCYAAERVGIHSSKRPGWPMTCVASGVNAAQAGELKEHFKRSGVPTEVTRDGDPIYTSPSHRRKALKCRGMIDKDGY